MRPGVGRESSKGLTRSTTATLIATLISGLVALVLANSARWRDPLILVPLPCGLHDGVQIGFLGLPSQQGLSELRIGDERAGDRQAAARHW